MRSSVGINLKSQISKTCRAFLRESKMDSYFGTINNEEYGLLENKIKQLKSENEKLRLKFGDLKRELENVPTNSDFAELKTENEKLKKSEDVLDKLKNYLQDNKSPVKYSYETVLMIIEEIESE